jgi:hypothetical protein
MRSLCMLGLCVRSLATRGLCVRGLPAGPGPDLTP